MTEELNVVEEKKECNCPICKALKSDWTKKFLTTVLATFVGCSLAILAFGPKHPPKMFKCPPPCVKMMDRPMSPHYYKNFNRPMPPYMYKGELKRHGEFKRCHAKKGDFRRFEGKRPEFKKGCPRKIQDSDKKPVATPNVEK